MLNYLREAFDFLNITRQLKRGVSSIVFITLKLYSKNLKAPSVRAMPHVASTFQRLSCVAASYYMYIGCHFLWNRYIVNEVLERADILLFRKIPTNFKSYIYIFPDKLRNWKSFKYTSKAHIMFYVRIYLWKFYLV